MIVLVEIKYGDWNREKHNVYTVLEEIDVDTDEQYKRVLTKNHNFTLSGYMICDNVSDRNINTYYMDSDIWEDGGDHRLGNIIDAFVREKNIEKLGI